MMNFVEEKKEFFSGIIYLQPVEMNEHMRVMYDLFSVFDLYEVREVLYNAVIIALTGGHPAYGHHEKRADILYFYKRLLVCIEAMWIYSIDYVSTIPLDENDAPPDEVVPQPETDYSAVYRPFISDFELQKVFYNKPVYIKESDNPMQVMYDFFTAFNLYEIRRRMHDLFEAAITADYNKYPLSERARLVSFHKYFEPGLEGAWLYSGIGG